MKIEIAKPKILVAALALTIGAAFGASSANAQAATTRPLPGLWDFATHAALIYTTHDRYCLSQAEIDRFYANPCNHSNVCNYSTKVFKPDGSVYLDGTWTDKKGRSSKVKGNGTMKPDNMKLNINVRLSFGLPVSGTFTATRVAATCRK